MSQETDATNTRSRIFTRNFLFRMLAILLFVVLGTFAVFQSIQGERKKKAANLATPEDSTAAAALNGETSAAASGSPDPAAGLAANPASAAGTAIPDEAPVATIPAVAGERSELARFNPVRSSQTPEDGSATTPAPGAEPPKTDSGLPSRSFVLAAQPDSPASSADSASQASSLPQLNRPADRPAGMLPAQPVSSPLARSEGDLPDPRTPLPTANGMPLTSPPPGPLVRSDAPPASSGFSGAPANGNQPFSPPGNPAAGAAAAPRGPTPFQNPAGGAEATTQPQDSPAPGSQPFQPFGGTAIRPLPGSQPTGNPDRPTPDNSFSSRQFPGSPGPGNNPATEPSANPATNGLPPTNPANANNNPFNNNRPGVSPEPGFPGQPSTPSPEGQPNNPDPNGSPAATQGFGSIPGGNGQPATGAPAVTNPFANPSSSSPDNRPGSSGPAAFRDTPPGNPAGATSRLVSGPLSPSHPANGVSSGSPVPFGAASAPGESISGGPASTGAATAPMAVRTLPTPGESSLEGVQTPSLAIEKIAPREIQLNQPANFKIVVRNVGRIPASEVRVFDRVPEGSRLIRANPEPEAGRSPDQGLAWWIGDLPPGQQRVIELELRPERPGEIGSVAQVTFATQASARTRVTRPELGIEHTAPSQVLLGSPVTLQITVRNNGDGPATNVIVQEQVPEQLRYNEGIRDLEYEIGTLAPGQSRSLALTLQSAAIGAFRNTVAVRGDGDLQASHETSIEVISPRLAVTSNGPNRRYLKRDATHQFSIQNTGTASATNLDLVAQLPRAVRFASANNQGQYDPGSHAVYWSLAELRATQTATVELVTQPVETGNVQIEFIARSDLEQRSTHSHPLLIEHLVDVHFELDDVTDHIETGTTTEYRVRIVNQGTMPANNVRLTAEFAPGMRPDSVAGGLRGEPRGQVVQFEPIANLNPGEEILASIVATGIAPGEHRVAVSLQSDGREINLSKEESTHVYSDR